ncbi:MAG: formate dehydrogenase accessory sulfurtransferase FdhD [Chloroflexota bacterium]|nr:formate dehydrogenase accessory sulfurtransferase FdhD [Chloroflexota bacterium]
MPAKPSRRTTAAVDVYEVADGQRHRHPDTVVREVEVWLKLDGRLRQRLFCLPANMEDLSAGYWASRGVATSRPRVTHTAKAVVLSAQKLGAFSFPGPASDITITEGQVLEFVEALDRDSQVFRKTGGTHVVGLFCGSQVVSVEDVSRHCAVDKVIGLAIGEGLDLQRAVLVTSCRQTMSTMLKAVNGHIPVVITVSAPTDLAIKKATESGVTLVGFARGQRFNVYSHAWRIVRTPR